MVSLSFLVRIPHIVVNRKENSLLLFTGVGVIFFIILEERRNDNGILSFTRASVCMSQRDYAATWSLFLLQKTLHILNIVCYFLYSRKSQIYTIKVN